MNPENSQENTEVEIKQDHLAPLKCVTPLSKYLAMALFIILPFLGAWVGYTYAPEKVVEVEKAVNNLSDWDIGEGKKSSNVSGEVVITLLDEYERVTGQKVDVSSTTIRIMEKEIINKEGFNSVSYIEIENIVISEDIIEVSKLPYLTVISTTASDEMILTRFCFADKACRYSKLYRLDLVNKTLNEMLVSKFYDDLFFGSIVSPDKTKVITSSHPYLATSSDLYVLDLVNDSYVLLDSYNFDSQKIFCDVGVGCDLHINWLSNHVVDVDIFDRKNRTKETKQYNL